MSTLKLSPRAKDSQPAEKTGPQRGLYGRGERVGGRRPPPRNISGFRGCLSDG